MTWIGHQENTIEATLDKQTWENEEKEDITLGTKEKRAFKKKQKLMSKGENSPRMETLRKK